jgi:hypothetical protein
MNTNAITQALQSQLPALARMKYVTIAMNFIYNEEYHDMISRHDTTVVTESCVVNLGELVTVLMRLDDITEGSSTTKYNHGLRLYLCACRHGVCILDINISEFI